MRIRGCDYYPGVSTWRPMPCGPREARGDRHRFRAQRAATEPRRAEAGNFYRDLHLRGIGARVGRERPRCFEGFLAKLNCKLWIQDSRDSAAALTPTGGAKKLPSRSFTRCVPALFRGASKSWIAGKHWVSPRNYLTE
jgi:hypothetical protein